MPSSLVGVLVRIVNSIRKALATADSVLQWLEKELTLSTHQDERIQQRTIKNWQDEWDRLKGRLDAMYEDKLDGGITSEQFDRKAKEIRSKRQALRAKISQHQTTAVDLRAGFNMMKLTRVALQGVRTAKCSGTTQASGIGG